jgi:hypothetical protein
MAKVQWRGRMTGRLYRARTARARSVPQNHAVSYVSTTLLAKQPISCKLFYGRGFNPIGGG